MHLYEFHRSISECVCGQSVRDVCHLSAAEHVVSSLGLEQFSAAVWIHQAAV